MENTLNHRRFNHVLFDLGNTLFYFQGSYQKVLKEGYQAVAHTLLEMGHIREEQTFLQRFIGQMELYTHEREITQIEQTSLVVLQRTLQEFSHQEITKTDLRQAINMLYEISEQHWEIEEDTVPCLETLKSQGYRLGIISNAADSHDVNALIKKGQLSPYFDQIIISAEFGLRKPHPKIFHKALSYWHALPEETVMIGDTLNADIIGAQKVHMPAIWITRRTDPPGYRGSFATIEPDAIITNLAELPEVLKNWE